MQTFVLVHGAWHGGWCWRRVADILTGRGHRIYSPTLTGLGERSHLLSREINLDTHILDVVNLFKWEDIDNAVLCGHSYGGWVISGAVEHLESRVSSIIFLDAHVPKSGQSGQQTSNHRHLIEESLKKGEICTPPPKAAEFQVNEKDQSWVDAKLTPQPIGVSLQEIRLSGARERVQRKAYIRATGFNSDRFDGYFREAKASQDWRTYEVSTGHDVMIDMPQRLVEILCEMA
jgi:pimeloyl-ACP methyl ester carboxylesterase